MRFLIKIDVLFNNKLFAQKKNCHSNSYRKCVASHLRLYSAVKCFPKHTKRRVYQFRLASMTSGRSTQIRWPQFLRHHVVDTSFWEFLSILFLAPFRNYFEKERKYAWESRAALRWEKTVWVSCGVRLWCYWSRRISAVSAYHDCWLYWWLRTVKLIKFWRASQNSLKKASYQFFRWPNFH